MSRGLLGQYGRLVVVDPAADAGDERRLRAGHLAIAAVAAELDDRLGQGGHALQVEAGQLAAARVDRQLAAGGDPAAAGELARLGALAKPVLREQAERDDRERVV